MATKKVIASASEEGAEVTQATETKKLKAENTKLKKNLEAISAELDEVKRIIENFNNNPVPSSRSESISNEDILVRSLCGNSLSVGTESHGRGTVYHFNEFGEEQEIPYGDLRDIVRNNRRFAESGIFYIEDKEAVKKLRLGQAYKRCLNVDEMKDIMSQTPEEFMKLYDKASDLQKDSIIGMIIEAKSNGGHVDANIVDQVSRRSGKNLMDID